MAAVFDLNEPAHIVHWHFFQMSVANIVVIVAMLAVFALALVVPFPGAERRQVAREQVPPGGPSPPGRPATDGPAAAGPIENEP